MYIKNKCSCKGYKWYKCSSLPLICFILGDQNHIILTPFFPSLEFHSDFNAVHSDFNLKPHQNQPTIESDGFSVVLLSIRIHESV